MSVSRKYNPGFLSDQELIAEFCVRHKELDLILETIRENDSSSIQHILTIGPRGSGKSTLLLRAIAEIRREPELREQWIPVVFSEESYEVQTIGEFWLECLFHIAEQEPLEDSKKNLMLAYHELLASNDDDATLTERARSQALDYADRHGKRLILLVENLNMMFDDMIDADDAGWKLRHTLENEPRIMLAASATSRFSQIDNSGKALFELFRVIELLPLKTKESAELWRSVSGHEPEQGAIRAIEILTGGNPRLLNIVARFGGERSFPRLMNEILDLIDDHTEYFKSHLERLPAKERRVYLALADLWAPATSNEIAQRARQDIRICAAHLNRLLKRGVIAMEPVKKKRKNHYYLNERMYNIYYLLRRRRRPEAMATALVRFMEAFYSKKELQEIGTELGKQGKISDRGMAPIYYQAYTEIFRSIGEAGGQLLADTPWEFMMEVQSHDPKINLLVEKLEASFQRLGEGKASKEELNQMLKALEMVMDEQLASGVPENSLLLSRLLLQKGYLHIRMEQPMEAIKSLDELLRQFEAAQEPELREPVARSLINKGIVLGKLEKNDQALEIYNKFLQRFGEAQEPELRILVAKALINKGVTLGELGIHDQELKMYDELLRQFEAAQEPELRILVANSLVNKGFVLGKLGKNDQALETFEEFLQRFGEAQESELRILVAKSLINKGVTLGELGIHDQELKMYDELLRQFEAAQEPELRILVANSLVNKGFVLGELGKNDQALETFDKFLQRFGEAQDPELRGAVARSLFNKGVVLGKLERSELELLNIGQLIDFKPEYEITFHKTLLNYLILASVRLGPEKLLTVLEEAPQEMALQPLVVALQLEVGREVNVPVEMLEVAKDIRKAIKKLSADSKSGESQP